jgi:CRP-like cAMP-binding protein
LFATKSPRSRNSLLDRLPKDERAQLLASAETVWLSHGQEIYRQAGPMAHVYFPISGAICLMVLMEDGRAIDVTSVGNEGMIGIPVFLGLEFSPMRTIVQIPGQSLRLATSAFLPAVKTCATLNKLLRRYVTFRLGATNQTVACHLLHSVQERMSRWLLTAQDRAGPGEDLLFTQEFLADMLGVRRQTVSLVAQILHAAGLISYRRGKFRIINREGLAAACCECYSTTKSLYGRIVA